VKKSEQGTPGKVLAASQSRFKNLTGCLRFDVFEKEFFL